MKLKFYDQERDGKDFEFSKSLGVKLLGLSENSEHSIRRALQELVKVGFIEQTVFSNGGGRKNKQPNKYRFSTRWKTYKKIEP